MKLTGTIVVALLLALSQGCSSTRPAAPRLVDPSHDTLRYSPAEYESDVTDYRDALANEDLRTATVLRDQMIYRVQLEIDANYHVFEGRLFESRAHFNTSADWIELGLAGAVGIAGGAEAKTVLGIVLTAIKGGRLSLDKNFFREKTTETLMTAMQAEREKRLTLITKKMTNGDASQYQWDEAWVDLCNYFHAGTIESGLLAISAQTGATATEAKDELETAEKDRADTFTLRSATKAEISEVRDLTKQLGRLKKANNAAAAAKILDELDVTPAPGADVFALVADQIDAIEPGERGKLHRLRVSNAFRHALGE